MAGLIFDILIFLVLKKIPINIFIIANSYLVIEFLFISFFYKKKLFQGKNWFNVLIAVLITSFVIHTYVGGLTKLNGYGAALFFFPTYFIYGIAGLYQILKEQKEYFLGRSSFFWANVAFLTFFPGNFFVFLFQGYLLSNNKAHVLAAFWIFHDLFNALMNILLGFSLYFIARPAINKAQT